MDRRVRIRDCPGLPAFLGRKLSSKHIIAVPVGIGLAGLGLALANAVSFDWMTRPCVGIAI